MMSVTALLSVVLKACAVSTENVYVLCIDLNLLDKEEHLKTCADRKQVSFNF